MGDDRLDLELSDEVLSVIPMDPFEQLDLARKITSMAIASRVSNLDSEVVELRQKIQGQETVVRELEEKTSRLERDRREADSRLKTVLEENMILTKEKDSLAMTVTKLTRDLAKLETFKRQLIKSLSDESAPPMNSRQVLRVIQGAWYLHQNGEWSFERKPNDLGFPAIVRTSENFESLDRIVRSLYNLPLETPIAMTYRLPEWMLVPDGNKTPPITIQETPDVEVMMAVRAWFADLTLSVTIGAEDVARYQFFCRTDFNIGSSSYKFENGAEYPSFEGFLGETVVASQNTLEKYFDEQEMMVIHRVHLEMEKAKLDLENQQCYDLIHGNEIIIINDTDSDGDSAEPLGQNTLSVTVFNTGPFANHGSPFATNGLFISDETNGVALESEYISEPNMSNGLPMEFYEGIPIDFTVDADNVFVQPSSPVMQDDIQFWEGFIGAENHNGVKDEDHSEEMEVDIELSQIFPELQQTGNSSVQDANSSTDSAPDLDNINNVVLGCENDPENLSNTQPIYDNPLVSEDVLDATDVIASAEIMPQDSSSVDLIPSANNSPAISMNVGLIPNPALEVDNLVINLDDYSSEDSMDSGVF